MARYINQNHINNNKTTLEYNKNKTALFLFDFVKTIICVFSVMIIIFTFFVREVSIEGDSMRDLLHDKDKVVINDIFYTPKNNDIVVIDTPYLEEKRIIKRVIATEGQTLSINYDTGDVCVDGIIIDEDYIFSETDRPSREYEIPYTIPEDHVFVMGDNRVVSLDSRDSKIGLVPVKDIIGKAQFIFFPFDRITYLY